ncbi:helix-turn-helix domain-containing protein [Streptomyces sp. CAS3]
MPEVGPKKGGGRALRDSFDGRGQGGELGRLVREMRQDRGFTQGQVAERMGVSNRSRAGPPVGDVVGSGSSDYLT